jgi:NADH dehydrogenase FAD-containing subunit
LYPDLADKSLIPYEATYGKHFLHGRMVGIDPENKTVLLKDGQQVTYDILVLASGTSGPFPSKMGHVNKEEALELYHNYADTVRTYSH